VLLGVGINIVIVIITREIQIWFLLWVWKFLPAERLLVHQEVFYSIQNVDRLLLCSL
jgi:hypothetical protein